MKIHEYQSKMLCRKYGIDVPDGDVSFTADEAVDRAKILNKMPVIIKAQIHSGGRGKSGGVKLAKSLDEVRSITNEMIGMKLITHQTKAEGQKIKKVLVEQSIEISKEYYLSILSDRTTNTNVVIASEAGGVDIEEVADNFPEKIIRVSINPLLGIQNYHCRRIVFGLNIVSELRSSFTKILFKLYNMFIGCDCSLLEINPLILSKADEFIALDSKIDIDSNSLYRHTDIKEFRDTEEEDLLELEASEYNLNYINLGGNGNIGNMVNGAGLAMATMDMIKKIGAEPANFLDVGGGADERMVEKGFEIILKDNNVKGVLINIFGGILRCDVLAKGVIRAARKKDIRKIPVVIRMEGTNVKEGKKMLCESGIDFIMANDLKEAAQQVIRLIVD